LGSPVTPGVSYSPLLKLTGACGKAVDFVSRSLGFLGGVLLLAAGFVVTYEVIARYIFSSPTKWTFEVSILLVLMSVFAAVAYGLKEGSHVRVQVLFNLLPIQTRAIFEIISNLFVLGYSILFVLSNIVSVTRSYTLSEKTPLLNWPLWPVKAVVLFAFIMLAVQAVSALLTNAGKLMSYLDQGWYGLRFSALMICFFVVALTLGMVVSTSVSPVVGLVIVLIVLLAAGVPVGFSVAVVSTTGFAIVLDLARGLDAAPKIFYQVWNDFAIMAVPLFVFLGYMMHRFGLATDIYQFARMWVGHIPGGLAVATIGACAIFAAISGSSMANAVTIGLVAIPAMISYKYSKRMAAGLVAVGGTLGVLIPPSTAFLLIGVMTQESIGHLFMAGVVPGIVAFVLLAIMAVLICIKTGAYEPLSKATFKERMESARGAAGSLLMPVIILGGIYSGVCTPTEAAGVAVVYAFFLALLMRRVNVKEMVEVIAESTKTVAMIAVLVGAGMALSNVTAMLQVPQAAAELAVSSGLPGWMVVTGTLLLIFILGMFLDGGAIVILTMPILAPVIHALGYDLIWYAVLVVLCTEIGLITPPVGMNVFIVQQISKIDTVDVIRGSIPFVIVLALTMLLVALFPSLALWLPGRM